MSRIRVALTVLALLAVTTTAGCGRTSSHSNPPWCDDFSVLILEAQSVPTAQLVPCLDLMPLGWSVGDTSVSDRGTVLTLDSTIAGDGAARVELGDECDITGHVQVPTDEVDTERFELVESIVPQFQGRRVYAYDGGCTSIELSFDVDVSAALVSEVSLALGFVTRDEVNEAVRTVTDGREQLDPTG